MTGELSFEQLISAAIREIPATDPTEFIKDMYRTVSKPMMSMFVEEGRKKLQYENNRSGKPVNCYFALGGDGNTRSLFTGVICGMLWLRTYLDEVAESVKINTQDLETTKKVLDAGMIPNCFDAHFDEKTGEMKKSSSARHYAAVLASFTRWATNGCSMVKTGTHIRSNLEVGRCLTSNALGSVFPALPFTLYLLGSIRTTNILELTERMGKIFRFEEYMSKESIAVNQPRFIVQTDGSPIVGIAGHPLVTSLIGQSKDGNIEWLGLFANSEEFDRKCLEYGCSANELRKYFIEHDIPSHKEQLRIGNKVAVLIEKTRYIRDIYEQWVHICRPAEV
jgi:hypothetical protein